MNSESKKCSSVQHDDQYTTRDTDQFSALISQCQQPSSTYSEQDENVLSEVRQQFEYTQGDDAAFEKLMHLKSEGHSDADGENKNIQYFAKAKTRDGYVDTDHELFTKLMSFDENTDTESKPQNQASADQREFSYSDQDQHNFDRLNPQDDSQDSNQVDFVEEAQDIFSSKNDRDVGFVKIIEYDKLKSERSKPKDRPNGNIKVRFFD